MKKQDIEICIEALNNIRAISDKQIYNVSSAINKEIIKIRPILEEEHRRMNEEKIVINCPAIMFIGTNEIDFNKDSLSEFINKKLQELVLNDKKIIDYGLSNKEGILAYIKYTS